MTSNATDTPGPAQFDTFEPLPTSAASFSGEAGVWQTAGAGRFLLFLAIFAVAGALISSEPRSPFTRVLEQNFSINAWLAAESVRLNQSGTRTPIQLWSLPFLIGFKRIAGPSRRRFGFTLAALRSCSRPSAMMSVNGLPMPYATFFYSVPANADRRPHRS